MKFVKMTFQYFTLKKFLQLVLAAAIPSIALALISTVSSISDFLINYYEMDFSSFVTIFNSVSEFRFDRIGFYIICIVVFIIFLTEVFGAVERDMRVGDFTLRGFFRRLNNNAFAVSLTVLILMLSILIMGVLSAAFFLLWSVLFFGIASHILSMVTSVVLFALLVICWVNFFLLVPNMIITGQSAFASMRESIRHTQGIVINLIFAIILPLIPMFIVVYAERLLNLNIEIIIDIIVNDLLIVYYVVLMLVVQYDVTGLSREDLNPASRFFR